VVWETVHGLHAYNSLLSRAQSALNERSDAALHAGSLTGVGPLVPTVTRVHASLHVYAVNLNVYVPD